MPLKLAGILMKYMQLQRAQMSSCQSPTDQTLQPFLHWRLLSGRPAYFTATTPFPTSALWIKEGEHPTGKLRETTHFSLLCKRSLPEPSVHLHVGSRQGSARAGSTEAFCTADCGAGLCTSDCFSAIWWCTARSKDLRASRNSVKTQRA